MQIDRMFENKKGKKYLTFGSGDLNPAIFLILKIFTEGECDEIKNRQPSKSDRTF